MRLLRAQFVWMAGFALYVSSGAAFGATTPTSVSCLPPNTWPDPPPPAMLDPKDGETGVPTRVGRVVVSSCCIDTRSSTYLALVVLSGSDRKIVSNAGPAVRTSFPLPSGSGMNQSANAVPVAKLEPKTKYYVYDLFGVDGFPPGCIKPSSHYLGSFTTGGD